MAAPDGVEDEILASVFRGAVQEFAVEPMVLTPCLKLPVAVILNFVVEDC
jgi:predicted LPLAT superfamily acyltransferase